MRYFLTTGLFVLITFLSFAFAGCSKSDTDIVRENAEDYLEQTLDDASSYEFVRLEYKEEITQRDNLNFRIDRFNRDLERAEEAKKRQEESRFLQESLKRTEIEIERNLSIIPELESLKESLGDKLDETACHVYEFDFRASNQMGGIVLTNSHLYVNPDLEVTHLATTFGQMLNTCNELEEYRDVIRNNPLVY